MQSQAMRLLTSSQTDEWYTPPRYVEAARWVMSEIDLDPASSREANLTVRATKYFTKEEDGLSREWFGKVWLNPPYGKLHNQSLQGLFAAKLLNEYEAGRVSEAVMLVNLYPGYEWFKPLRTLPMCMVDHRINFINPLTGQQDSPAKASSVFIYFGPPRGRGWFYEIFAEFGPVGQFSYLGQRD